MLRLKRLGAMALVAIGLVLPVEAKTVRWASSSEIASLDPHAVAAIPNLALLHQMYDPLVVRAADGALTASLATSWRMLEEDPSVWEFKLRPGVRFHDGAPLTAQDVVFSIERAQGPAAQVRAMLPGVQEVRAVDALTVQIRTQGKNLIFPDTLTHIFIMNADWTRAQGAEAVQDVGAGQRSDAGITHIANGTGAYRLVSHEAGVKTVMQRSSGYWGEEMFPLEVSEIVYLPIRSDATRMAALLSGEVDLVQDIPAQDVARLKRDSQIRVNEAAENRVIALGLQVGPALHNGAQPGKNPLSDARVREAMELAIDRDTLKRTVMRGLSIPTRHLAGPFDNGHDKALVAYAKPDIVRAQALLREAGYPDGFTLTLDTPNDRYINDEAIATAVAGFLGRIGIRVQVVARPMAQHLPLLTQAKTDFYLFGLTSPTFDSAFLFDFLVHTRGSHQRGVFNATGYSNAELDEGIVALATEIDKTKRDATIAHIWQAVAQERIYIPLHYQMQQIASIPQINLPVPPDAVLHFKTVQFQP